MPDSVLMPAPLAHVSGLLNAVLNTEIDWYGDSRWNLWAVLVAVDDERGAEFRGERRERAASMRALLERAWVVAKEKVDLAAAGEALKGGCSWSRCSSLRAARSSTRRAEVSPHARSGS